MEEYTRGIDQREASWLPLRGARGSAARLSVMTLVEALSRSKAELLSDGALEEVQFTRGRARAEDLRLGLVAYPREPRSP